MRKFSFLLAFLLFPVLASAKVTFSGTDLNIKPGEAAQLELNLTNDVAFAGFQLDIVLPDGLKIDGATKKQQTTLCGSIEDFDYVVGETSEGNYGIRVYSTERLTIEPGSGKIISVNLKADEDIGQGNREIKIANIILSQGGVPVDLDDVTVKVTVNQVVSLKNVNLDKMQKNFPPHLLPFTIFDLNGRKVVNGSVNHTLRKGLYIQNGKMMMKD